MMDILRNHLRRYANKFEFKHDLWLINNELFDRNKQLEQQLAETKAKLEEAEKDTARLDWVELECRKNEGLSFSRNATEMFSVTTQHIRAPSLRKLIDKAIASQKGE